MPSLSAQPPVSLVFLRRGTCRSHCIAFHNSSKLLQFVQALVVVWWQIEPIPHTAGVSSELNDVLVEVEIILDMRS